ncbi:RND transporter [uncultured Aliiroseovarius sp.]|uniref:RND transporter n=1 Tax=uncultured Aliiroseovarius sp. TaxID=1658783 RepID=UPI002628A266|nr:RND transporter [uncultured Aliiroseovarius sp.]
MSVIDDIPLLTVLIFCATIGLAPFTPPHVWEKLVMLFSGTLVRPIDMFDLLMHGTPWVVLVVKLVRMRGGDQPGEEG